MAYLWEKTADVAASAFGAHSAAPAPPARTVPAITVGAATDGLVSLEKICLAARQAIAAKGGDLQADANLTLAVLDLAAEYIPAAAQIDEAAHVAAVLIPVLVELRRANPIGPANADPLGRGGRRA